MTDKIKYTPNPLYLIHQWITGISTQVLSCLSLHIPPHMENPSWYSYLTNNSPCNLCKKAIWHVPPARFWSKNYWIKRLPNNNQKRKADGGRFPFFLTECRLLRAVIIPSYILVQNLPSWDSIKDSDDERKYTQTVVQEMRWHRPSGCC